MRHAPATWLALSGNMPVIHTGLFMQKIHISSASVPPAFLLLRVTSIMPYYTVLV